MERYLRHDLIDWFSQDLVKQTRALVIGAGAVGNEVIKNLALLGVGSIHIVDFDTIEAHNLTRSVLFNESDIGRRKAETAAAAARLIDPNCNINYSHGDFWDVVSFAEIQNATVVFSCVDGFLPRLRINQLCSLLGTDLVNAGIDSRFVSTEIYPFGRNPESACYECNLPPTTYQRLAERYSCGWLKKVAYEEKKIPTTAITASFAGAMATSMFLYSYREDSEEHARRFFLDTIGGFTTRTLLPRSSTCACCSADQSKIKIIISARRAIAPSEVEGLAIPANATVTTSDKILVGWTAPNCSECAQLEMSIVFDLASKFDDSQVVCDKCNMKQKLAVIRDQFTIEELLGTFKGRHLPGKYIMFHTDTLQAIVELNDGDE